MRPYTPRSDLLRREIVAAETIGEFMRVDALKLLAALSSAILMSACAHDYDNNPPGRRGGPGTNWENPPGAAGGPGASPDRRRVVVYGRRIWVNPVAGGYYFHRDYGYWRPGFGWYDAGRKCFFDRDGNPPGRRGGRGSNWENPPGLAGGPGASPDSLRRCG
jgi:hypothetical protein